MDVFDLCVCRDMNCVDEGLYVYMCGWLMIRRMVKPVNRREFLDGRVEPLLYSIYIHA